MCPDYDLCEKCMKMGVHDPSHRMLEIKEPDAEALDSKVSGLLLPPSSITIK